MREARARELSNARRALSDAAGEHECVEAAEQCHHRADPGPQPVHLRVRGAFLGARHLEPYVDLFEAIVA